MDNYHNKKWYMNKFAKDYTKDAGWVDLASDLLSTYTWLTEEDVNKFSAEQLSIIKQGYEIDKDPLHKEFPDFLIHSNFNSTQLQIIITAYKNGVSFEDIKKYIGSEEIPYNKMNYISQALVDGIDVFNDVDHKEWDIDQIYEIYAAAKSGVDLPVIEDYKKYHFSAETMGLIRHAYELGLAVRYTTDEETCLMVNIGK